VLEGEVSGDNDEEEGVQVGEEGAHPSWPDIATPPSPLFISQWRGWVEPLWPQRVFHAGLTSHFVRVLHPPWLGHWCRSID
jgi:hypothetical protein